MTNKEDTLKDEDTGLPDIWPRVIKQYLINRKKLHVLSYQDISDKLTTYHFKQSPQNLSAKFNQGKLSASLLVASLLAMGEDDIDLAELKGIIASVEKVRSS